MRLHRQRWFLTILSGVLQVLIFPDSSIFALSWIGLTPMLLAVTMPLAEKLPTPAQSALIAYLAGVIFYVGSCRWIYHVLHIYGNLSSSTSTALLLLFSLFLAIHHAIFGFFLAVLARSRRIGPLLSVGISPLLWIAVELGRDRITGFPWNLLGYAQIDNVPLTRLATWTGAYGVSFVIAFLNAAFAAAAFLAPTSRRIAALTSGFVIALLLQAGVLVHLPAPAADRRALLVQQDLPILNTNWTQQYFDETMSDLSALSSRPAESLPKDRLKLVVWPESPAPFYLADPTFRQSLSALATGTNSYLIVGSLGPAPSRSSDAASQIFNSAALISPEGVLSARYDKIHLVPFGEYVPAARLIRFAHKLTKDVADFSRGSTRLTLPIDNHQVGVFICYESIFPDEVRQFAAAGADVFINISNDEWFGESGAPRQHLNLARMRAIENDRWLLRATNTGITAAVDPYGRIVSQSHRNVRAALVVPYTFISGKTFYSRHGDWFAFGCVMLTLIVLATSQFSVLSRAGILFRVKL